MISNLEGKKVILPTGDQWQYCAQGNDSRTYPWGNDWDCQRCNNSVKPCDSDVTTSATKYQDKGASAFGVVDMAGNVWEWCLTDYDNMTNNVELYSNRRVLRGGSWHNTNQVFRTSYQWWEYPHCRYTTCYPLQLSILNRVSLYYIFITVISYLVGL